MILDIDDVDDDQSSMESGILVFLLIALLGMFYQLIADKMGPEL